MAEKKIEFNSADLTFELKNKTKIRAWIDKVIKSEGFVLEQASYVFCSDKFLLKLNKSYLNHTTLTDIITFDLSDKKMMINGELYISIDRIKENAKSFNCTTLHELHRVMIHGILHLCGYKDKTPKDQQEMRALEDHYLSILNFS